MTGDELSESWWTVDFNVNPCPSVSPDGQWHCKLGEGHRTPHRNTGGVGICTKQWFGGQGDG